MRNLAFFAAFAAVVTVAACSNANDGGNGCSTSQGPQPVLLYPAPNSTGVTAGLQEVAVYDLGGALGYVNLVPLNTSEPTLQGGQFVPASPLPLPSPAASAPAGATIYSSSVPEGLVVSGATYNVQFVPNKQPPCGPQQTKGVIGQFTVANP
jgi:hypothetical protein